VLSSLIIKLRVEASVSKDTLTGVRPCKKAVGAATLNPHPQLRMKSAYELAMERLEKQSPTRKLRRRQKSEIAEIDSVTRSKVAEREVFLQGQIDKARAAGEEDEARELEGQLGAGYPAAARRRGGEEGEDSEEKLGRVRVSVWFPLRAATHISACFNPQSGQHLRFFTLPCRDAQW
jgi:hypothetical protein